MPTLQNSTWQLRGFEPGISRLRVQHSPAELPHSTRQTIVSGTCLETEEKEESNHALNDTYDLGFRTSGVLFEPGS